MPSEAFPARAITRRAALLGTAAAAAASALPPGAPAQSAGLRVAMSLADIPRAWGGPDGGFEGIRFGGYTIYDGLLNYDLSRSDVPGGLVPALAESWTRDPADATRWIFRLRSGVTFHDGSPFDADAAIWNFDAIFNEAAPQYNATRSAMVRPRIASVAGYEKIDAQTILVRTPVPDALLPWQLSFLFMASPAQYAKLGNDWQRFAMEPAGTGPWRVTAIVPRTRLELARNERYWDPNRVPKVPTLTLLPIPEANTRVAALRAGQVDIIESVPPDAIPSLRGARFNVLNNTYPHVWTWHFSTLPDSPFRDLRVRRAANMAVDREAIVQLLSGTAVPARGLVPPGSPWDGNPSWRPHFDQAAARRLMQEAGYGPNARCKAKVLIANSGGGQMVPLPMNEAIKEDLAKIWLDVDYQVVDFITLFTGYRNGARAPSMAGIHAINIALPTQDPTTGFTRAFHSELVAPRGTNWGHIASEEADAAMRAAQAATDTAALNAALTRTHERLVEHAVSLMVVHDTNPRALAPRVRGFVQPQNWFADFTTVVLG